MSRRLLVEGVLKKGWIGLVVLVLMGGLLPGAAMTAQAAGGVFYESRPDEVALYLSDIAFARDTVVLPVGQEASILLPPGTYLNTLILKEDGRRVPQYRVTPVAQAAMSTTLYSSTGQQAYVLTWEPVTTTGETRTVSLEYLLPGAMWTPSYDMTILDDTPDAAVVDLAFFAEITNRSLTLDQTTVYLVAGRVALDQQIDQVPQVTMNQYMVGYSNETVSLPGPAVGAVNLQHVYPMGKVSAAPGDTIYAQIASGEFGARRLVMWYATTKQETDVIYKVRNTAEVPLAEGIVRAYQNNLFLGSDYIETTPVGSEGSITVGSLPDVRVHRTATHEYVTALDDYYQHEVTLEIQNFGEEALDLVVFDSWQERAWDFEFSLKAERQPDNLLRWEVNIPAGESVTITYQYRTDA